MAWEQFKSKGGKFTPQITLNKSGGFGMTSGAHHRHELDKYNGVILYYDKEANKVGVRLVVELEPGMFRLKKRPEQKGAYFSARSFLEAYNIDPKQQAGRYDFEEVSDQQNGNMFVIQLKSN